MDNNAQTTSQYTFTVKRITQLQDLLSSVEKRLVNKFITEIRYSVTTYHAHKLEADKNKKIRAHERFFSKLNDKAHQLARFTSELSILVNEAPSELFDEAKKADRAIDKIHGNLVNLCLSIDTLSQQKSNFYHDASVATQDIYNAYCEAFNTLPNGRPYEDLSDISENAPIEDLLVPVLEVLLLKDLQRCYKLAQGVKR